MKKFWKTLASAALAAVMGVSAFGCNLIETDLERDMSQVVATVQISEDAPVENIYKRDLVLMYINYGYSYVQQGTYTQAQVFEMLMEQLVNNAILVQNAIMVKAEQLGITENIYDLEAHMNEYFTEEEQQEALYNTNKALNDVIDSYKDAEEEEEESETSSETVRTVPTGATNYEPEWGDFDNALAFYKDYNSKGFTAQNEDGETMSGVETGFRRNGDVIEITDIETKRAYNKVVEALESNGLIGEDFDYNADSIYDTDYYRDSLQSQRESVLISWYEEYLTAEILSTVSYQDLEARYAEMYNTQKNYTVSEYETALDAWSASSPVVAYSYGGYGYVYNLLLGVNAAQKAEIEELGEEKNLSQAEYAARRERILSRTTAKDLRSTWITAGYDFDYETLTFTHDYSLASETYALPFQGTVKWVNEADKPAEGEDDEDYTEKYEITSVKEFDLEEFVAFLDETLYAGVDLNTDGTASSGYYRVARNTNGTEIPEYEDRINDLLFAFSTDAGSLNTYQGYLISPEAEADETETYVEEFAKAARELLTMEDGSYIIVGTDFGYHILFKSVALEADGGYPTLGEYLDSLGVEKKIGETTYTTWEEYYNAMIADLTAYLDDNDDNENFYLYLLQQAYVSDILNTELSNVQSAIVNRYKTPDEDGNYTEYKEQYVKIYENRYSEYLQD